jgi:site-specific DNA-methyltransferase (adenine-specific)/site-specific DNA-methyltransferase (cytosine-N4-specific)
MKLIHGDCLEKMENIQDGSIDMVLTSPPYADRRKKLYNGSSADKYIDWFMPFSIEIKRVLSPTGSFFLNIKAHTQKGERSLYVMKLVIALQEKVGFKFIDEFCWTKNAFPGALKGRLKNGFEPIFHFAKCNPSVLTFHPTACGTPIKQESIARTYRKQCGPPVNGSGMTGMNTINIQKLKLARPSNVIHVNNISNQFTDKQKHPATFPVNLVNFFIKTFSNEKDIVLDPFMGSGTTGIACKNLNRDFIGIEMDENYFKIAKQRIENAQHNQ